MTTHAHAPVEVVVKSYDDLHHALRARAETLDLSRETIDAISGVSQGYSSRLLSDPPTKRLSFDLVGIFLSALGLRLQLVEDPDAFERFTRRAAKRQHPTSVPLGPSPIERAREIWIENCRRGGKTSMRRKSQRERQAFGRVGGEARRDALTDWRRKKIAQNAAIARWAARKHAEHSASTGIAS
jgi:hypothetical protein